MYFKLLLPPLISDLVYPVPRHALFTCIIWDIATAASLIRLYRSPARGHDTRVRQSNEESTCTCRSKSAGGEVSVLYRGSGIRYLDNISTHPLELGGTPRSSEC
eukprot:SAG11_NODE_190_length_12980_cov_11.633802_10_plen_104_part_00